MATIAELLNQLEIDELRKTVGFSAGFAEEIDKLIKTGDAKSRAEQLSNWLSQNQPCLFGRIAAKTQMIQYCFLTDDLLMQGDAAVRDVIQDARLRWWASAAAGEKSGFIVALISETASRAAPTAALFNLSQRICELYLREEIQSDSIYLDEVFLEIPDRPRERVWRWKAGVNFFAAAGDQRWWHDHRMPVGTAFSVNSVGHMVKSAQLGSAMSSLRDQLELQSDEPQAGPVNSLGAALRLAMSTIANATNAVSGKATWLRPLQQPSDCPAPPIALGRKLEEFDHCTYQGAYHTDYTLPSSYFRQSVERPGNVGAIDLDFTYLFVNSSSNPAHETMGAGERIRGDTSVPEPGAQTRKAERQWPARGEVEDFPSLRQALANYGNRTSNEQQS